LAILALDAYNRGYNPGMTFTGDSDSVGTEIGDATILQATDDLPSQNSSFYAVAYSWEGETVISYRGTTFENNAANLGDVLNGWTLSLGFSQASQAQQALSFYTQIRNQVSGSIQLTGHSLGGGLAGFVSDLTGAPADVFNNIPFGSGVAAEILSNDLAALQSGTGAQGLQPLPSSSASVRQFITFGELLDYVYLRLFTVTVHSIIPID
jgi:hypothetical protein